MTTLQHPINSGFGPAATAADVAHGIDLHGKVAIVTGGYGGLGLETARVLHAAGAHVLVPARDVDRARRALAGLDGIDIAPLDLMDPASIDAFARAFVARGQPLHLLVNSAGIMASPLLRDKRGVESQFGTNHLGHFQLAAGLWPALRLAGGARVVAVSSWGHRQSPVHFDDIHFERREYDRWLAYGQSKTANVLFAVALDARGRDDGVRAFALHPGTIVETNLKKYVSEADLFNAGVIDADGRAILDPARSRKTVQQGASTSVWCATSARLDGLGGLYCQDNDVAPLVADGQMANPAVGSAPQGVMPYAVDPEAAERLWRLSEQLSGSRLA